MRRALLLGAAAWLCAAADRPPIMPTRDVDVTYRVAQPVQGGPPLSQRMRWLVEAGKLRVDPPTPGLFMIVDYPDKRMSVVKVADRAVLDVPTAAPGLPGAAAAAMERRDDTVVAGIACTNWLTKDAGGRPVMLCMTPDGVMLRAGLGDQVLLEAITVNYAPQNPADFTAPDGFRHIAGQAP